MSVELPEGYSLVPSAVVSEWAALTRGVAERLGVVSSQQTQLDRIVRDLTPLLKELRERREAEHKAAVEEARTSGDAAGYARAMSEIAKASAGQASIPDQIAEAVGKGAVGGLRGKGGQVVLGALAVGVVSALVILLARLTGVPVEVLLGSG